MGQDRGDAGPRCTPRGGYDMKREKRKKKVRLPDKEILHSTTRGRVRMRLQQGAVEYQKNKNTNF
jgi:hypothetical protein